MYNKFRSLSRSEFSFKIVLFTITFTTISILLIYNLLLVKKTDLYSGEFLESTLDSYLEVIVKEIDKEDTQLASNTEFYLGKLQDLINNSKYLIYLTEKKGDDKISVSYNFKEKKFVILRNNSARTKEVLRQVDKITDSNNFRSKTFKLNGNQYFIYFSSYDEDSIQKILPFIQLIVLSFLIFLTYFGYKFFKSNEESTMWVAMAKETAHQLGTPITSLSGWKDYLYEIKSDILLSNNNKENEGKVKDFIEDDLNLELDEIHKGIGTDINRISLVLERFSKIASEPEMGYFSIVDIINEVTKYLRVRIPNIKNTIEINVDFGKTEIENIYLSRILIEWSLENIIKNSIQAIDFNKKGIILVILSESKNKIMIDIKDNGKGLKQSQVKNIFNTGYTTKKRGWGIGLSLAKRVIDEYHDGKIFVLNSKPDVGTTIRIILNKLV